MINKEEYNPEQNYFFVDYGLEEHGHPEYIERMKEDDPSYPDMGSPRWIRQPMQTEQDVQETMNFVFQSFPHLVRRLRIRSEKELNEMVTIDEKTNKRLYRGDGGFDEGLKLTEREYEFGSMYQKGYEHTTGLIDDFDNPIKKQKVESKTKEGK
jgi:hypothetical protein